VVSAGGALVYGAVAAASGAYLLILAPAFGFCVALGVHSALRRVCTSGSRQARVVAAAGVASLAVAAVVGISFGGIALILPMTLLGLATALTPHPRAAT
jgi:hypothetical protein